MFDDLKWGAITFKYQSEGRAINRETEKGPQPTSFGIVHFVSIADQDWVLFGKIPRAIPEELHQKWKDEYTFNTSTQLSRYYNEFYRRGFIEYAIPLTHFVPFIEGLPGYEKLQEYKDETWTNLNRTLIQDQLKTGKYSSDLYGFLPY